MIFLGQLYQNQLASQGYSPSLFEFELRRSQQMAQLSRGIKASAFTLPVQQALYDGLRNQARKLRTVTIENIQKTVAEYYKIRRSDLLSNRRSRSITRPRQLAMALSKELTNHSLPEIGEAFGGRDHTTVLHGCRKIAELRDSDVKINEDYMNMMRILSN